MTQLELFDGGQPRHVRAADQTNPTAGQAYVGGLAHLQFEYDLCPALFGNRRGWGPLLLAPDTNVLIDLVDEFERLQQTFGFAGEHLALLSDFRVDRFDALSALFTLWFWRDVRFFVPPSYVSDSNRKPLSAERVARRRHVMGLLGEDLFARGGVERSGHTHDGDAAPEAWQRDDDRDRRIARTATDRVTALIRGNDGVLAAEAATVGCHVFLTEDNGVRARGERLRGIAGIVAMSPGEVMDALGRAGELEPERMSNGGLYPDLKSLATFYGAVGELATDAGSSTN